MDIQPVNPGHVLVIPRVHATYLADLDPAVGGEIFEAGMLVAAGLRRSGLRCEGVNFFLADGDAAGQEVFHLHLHSNPPLSAGQSVQTAAVRRADDSEVWTFRRVWGFQ